MEGYDVSIHANLDLTFLLVTLYLFIYFYNYNFFLIFNANLYMKHGICLHRIELLSYLVKLMICPLHHVPNFIDGKHMTFTKLYLMGV